MSIIEQDSESMRLLRQQQQLHLRHGRRRQEQQNADAADADADASTMLRPIDPADLVPTSNNNDTDIFDSTTSASSPPRPLPQQPALDLKTPPPIVMEQTLAPQSQPLSPSPQDQQQPAVLEQGFSVLGVWILAVLLVLLSIILVVLVVHVIRQRHRILSVLFPSYQQHYHNRRLRSRRHVKATQQRIERRYETIEGWIVSKRVVAHDEFCESCVDVFAKAAAQAQAAAAAAAATAALCVECKDENGNTTTTTTTSEAPPAANNNNNTTAVVDNDDDAVEFGMHTKKKRLERQKQLENGGDLEQGDGGDGSTMVVKHLETCETEDESGLESQADRECPICFEEFRVGQVISFSANPECSHVFHHECIKEWLLRHINCPFCRKVCMHVDEYRGACKQKPHVIQELLDKHSKRSATTYYCVRDGLVVIPPKVRCTKRELKQLKHRICDCIVDRQELAKLRGSRQEATVTNNTRAMMREINLTTTTSTAADSPETGGTTTVMDPAADTTALDIAQGDGSEANGNVGEGLTRIDTATTDDDSDRDTTDDAIPEQRPEDVEQQHHIHNHQRGGGGLWHPHHQEASTSSSRLPIVLLEMASVQDENDYDPTERDDDEDDALNGVFPQGQLDDASVSDHITVECEEDDDEEYHSDEIEHGAATAETSTTTLGTVGSLSLLGRQGDDANSSNRTTGTSTDDDEEMLLDDDEVDGNDVDNNTQDKQDDVDQGDNASQCNNETATPATSRQLEQTDDSSVEVMA